MKLDAEMSRLVQKAAQGFSQRHRREFIAVEKRELPEVPRSVLDEMESLGWLNALDDEANDDPSTNALCLAEILHELGHHCPALAARLLAHHFARICVGRESCAQTGWFGVEATMGIDRWAPSLTVKQEGQHLRLDGALRSVVGGTHAARWLGIARLDQGHRAMVLVNRAAAVRIAEVETLGLRGLGALDATFSAVVIEEDCRLAVNDEVSRRLERARRFVGPGFLLLLAAMLEDGLGISRNHAQLRRQNGVLLAELPAVQQMLETLERALAFTRVLSASATEQMCDVEKLLPEVAKAANLATDAGLQVLGGAGYIIGNGIEQIWRDVRQLGQLFAPDPW